MAEENHGVMEGAPEFSAPSTLFQTAPASAASGRDPPWIPRPRSVKGLLRLVARVGLEILFEAGQRPTRPM